MEMTKRKKKTGLNIRQPDITRVNGQRIRIATLNVGSMTRRSLELEHLMKKRRIDVMCVQETKWGNLGNKSRFLDLKTKDYKLFYHGINNQTNGVGIIISRKYLNNIINIDKVSDRLMAVKLVVQDKVWNIICAYAPQTGRDVSDKVSFWSDFEMLMQQIPPEELVVIGADMNGHVGETNFGFEECHGGYGYGAMNDEGEELLDFAKSYGLTLMNTMFKKHEKHLVTYSSGGRNTQIDYLLCSNEMRKMAKDCKVILGESVVSQHRLLVMDIELLKNFPVPKPKPVEKIKWINLDKENGTLFMNETQEWLQDCIDTSDELTANELWRAFKKMCIINATKHLGVSKGPLNIKKESWWWTEETKKAIKEKKIAFKKWTLCDSNLTEEKKALHNEYKLAKKASAKAVAIAQAAAKQDLYENLESSDGSNRIYKIAAMRRNQSKGIVAPKYIQDGNGKLLTKDEDICDRWKAFMQHLLNEEFPRTARPTENSVCGPVQEITIEEVEIAVKKMKRNKAVGPDSIPSEFWKKSGQLGYKFLQILFNKILFGDKMPDDFRRSYLLPFFKNKGDARNCSNYRGIKLMSHTMKIYERVFDSRIRAQVSLHKNQCGFVGGKSTTDATQALRILMEKYRDAQKDLHFVFIDLEKAFDRVPRDLIWNALRAHGVMEIYVRGVMDMYQDATTSIRCTAGTSKEFPIGVGVHQGSVCSPLLFNIVMNYLTAGLMSDLVLSMLFADDIVLASDDASSLQTTLDKWKQALESNGLKISRQKTEYMPCPFSDPDSGTPDIFLDGCLLKKIDHFKYLGSMVENDGSCDADLNHRISTGWMKWQQNSSVFCDKKMPPKLKGRLYTTVVRPALTYGTECWTMTAKHKQKLTSAENKMLRMSAGVTLLDKIQSKYIRGSLKVKETIGEAVDMKRHRWYGHVKRRSDDHVVVEMMTKDIPRIPRRGRPKESWLGQMNRFQRLHGITDAEIEDRQAYRRRLRSHTTQNTQFPS
ncbi:uncharacterized protein LOC134837472 [Culicoides brevitarsis]|uniref:uncharacterized protein LOC134837472 n=1 Tax=Culicoides brevitarsis TaxID=469753 RepID=UPI00307B90D0